MSNLEIMMKSSNLYKLINKVMKKSLINRYKRAKIMKKGTYKCRPTKITTQIINKNYSKHIYRHKKMLKINLLISKKYKIIYKQLWLINQLTPQQLTSPN